MASNLRLSIALGLGLLAAAPLVSGGCTAAATDPEPLGHDTASLDAIECDTDGDCPGGQRCEDFDCDGVYHCTSSLGGHYNCCDDSSDCGTDTSYSPPLQYYCGYISGRPPMRCLWPREGSPRPYSPLPSRDATASP
jgi:hypothetical protein